MRLRLSLVILATLFSATFANAQVSSQPACQFNYTFTNRTTESTDNLINIALTSNIGRSPNINNKSYNCNSWLLQFSVDGLTGVSIELDDSQNAYTTSGGTPLAWNAWQGTVLSGTNPTTGLSTSGLISVTGYYPWISVNVTASTGTGSIYATLYGWRTPTMIGQSFTPLLQFAASTCLSYGGTSGQIAAGNCTVGDSSGRLKANSFTSSAGNSGMLVSTVSGADVLLRANNAAIFDVRNDGNTQLNSTSLFLWGTGAASAVTGDTGLERISAGLVGINSGTTNSGGGLRIPALKSTTGTRYVCVDTNGTMTSSATACSGT